MRPIGVLIIYVAVVFIGGALLAPWLFWVARLLPSESLSHAPFHRYVGRALLLLALGGLWPLMRGLGARSWRDIGLTPPSGEWGRLAAGFALGFGSLACVAAIVLAGHGRRYNPDLSLAQIAEKCAGAAATAAIVAVLEEALFRGGIYGALRQTLNWRVALLVSAMAYAIVHFMTRAELAGPVTWRSGLALLPPMLGGFADWRAVIPGFFTLTLAGTILGLAYQRTGSLYYSIGLHAGWIFWLKFYGILTLEGNHTGIWFWGTQKLIDGWLALIILAGTLVLVARRPAAVPNQPG